MLTSYAANKPMTSLPLPSTGLIGDVIALQSAHDFLKTELEELLRLEDDGGPMDGEAHRAEVKNLTVAIENLTELISCVEESFQSGDEAPTSANKNY